MYLNPKNLTLADKEILTNVEASDFSDLLNNGPIELPNGGKWTIVHMYCHGNIRTYYENFLYQFFYDFHSIFRVQQVFHNLYMKRFSILSQYYNSLVRIKT